MQERAERREEVAAAAFHHVKRDHSTSPSQRKTGRHGERKRHNFIIASIMWSLHFYINVLSLFDSSSRSGEDQSSEICF